jgi:hypothetical protein
MAEVYMALQLCRCPALLVSLAKTQNADPRFGNSGVCGSVVRFARLFRPFFHRAVVPRYDAYLLQA